MAIKISLVIPNYNGRQLLKKNLPAIFRACNSWSKVGWEVVIVDDASIDDSVEFLKKNFPEVKVICHQKNQRFAAACNSGVKAAEGKVVVLLNTDVVPEIDFLKPLISHFNNPQVFAVGCLEKNRQNGKIIYSGRAEAKFSRGFLVHRRAKDQNKTDTFWTAGGSMAVSREKWLEIGGMDTLFRPAYYEDIDICWRARQKHWLILFEPNSIVNHHHETTNLAAFNKSQMQLFAYKNQFLLVWKNGDVKMLISHLFWLPYHLLKTVFRGDCLFYRGFILALRQLPEAISHR